MSEEWTEADDYEVHLEVMTFADLFEPPSCHCCGRIYAKFKFRNGVQSWIAECKCPNGGLDRVFEFFRHPYKELQMRNQLETSKRK